MPDSVPDPTRTTAATDRNEIGNMACPRCGSKNVDCQAWSGVSKKTHVHLCGDCGHRDEWRMS